MKRYLSLLIATLILFSGMMCPNTLASDYYNVSYNIYERSYDNTKYVNFSLYSGDMLIERIKPAGNTCKAEYYGCSQGSVHVSVYVDSTWTYITGFTIPYIGYTTCYVNINCTPNVKLALVVTWLSGNPAVGGFTIHY